jgi:glycosyltransferase involved in cell wall biosynthesis
VLLPYAKEYIVSRGISPEKVFWLPNGVNLDRFDHPSPLDPGSEVAKAFERYRDRFKVVYVGAHGVPNGLDVILEAAKFIQDKNVDITMQRIVKELGGEESYAVFGRKADKTR